MNKIYDILILGGGPIGASSAYFLSQKGKKKIGLITSEPAENQHATYQNAGGCIRWFWDEPQKTLMTKETADFIKKLSRSGVDVSLREDTYLFLYRGVHVPAINVSGIKLVNHFIKEAQAKGVTLHSGETVKKVQTTEDVCVVTTDKGIYQAKKVLLAMGAQNACFMPEYEIEEEKRYLLVLDLPVGESELMFPHTIAKIGDGYAFAFVKKLPEGWRFLVGQEDILGVPTNAQAAKHFKEFLATGVGDVMPFLKKAKVERMLSGTDVENKSLLIKDHHKQLFAANCGSAVRSCVWIGKEVARQLMTKEV